MMDDARKLQAVIDANRAGWEAMTPEEQARSQARDDQKVARMRDETSADMAMVVQLILDMIRGNKPVIEHETPRSSAMSEQNTVELRPAGDGMVTIHQRQPEAFLCENSLGDVFFSSMLQPLCVTPENAARICARENLSIIEPEGEMEKPQAARPRVWHELKTWPEPFAAILAGEKRYEIRATDRDFRIGDGLRLREYDPCSQKYTGREHKVIVTYMTPGGDWGLPPSVCVMSIEPDPASPADAGESVASCEVCKGTGRVGNYACGACSLNWKVVSRQQALDGAPSNQSASKGEVRRWEPSPSLHYDSYTGKSHGTMIPARPNSEETQYVRASDYAADIAERDERLQAYRGMVRNRLGEPESETDEAYLSLLFEGIAGRDMQINNLLAYRADLQLQLSQLQRDHAAEVERLKAQCAAQDQENASLNFHLSATEDQLSSALARVDEVEKRYGQCLMEKSDLIRRSERCLEREESALASRDALQRKVNEVRAFLHRAGDDGRIVSSGDLTELQIIEAQAGGRFLVDDDGFGWALLPWGLRTTKDARRESERTPALIVLRRHHNWHLQQTEPDQHGIVGAEAYAESQLCDDTSAILSRIQSKEQSNEDRK